jgi:RNA polymerase sigma-70 factor (ECF subfamily)
MSAVERTANGSEERPALSTSRSLLARAGANDPAAWDRLIALYAPLVWSWCRKMHLPHQDTADVFQEVFQAVATHLPRFHKSEPGDTFRGWLRTITRNKVRDYFRRRRREPAATGGTDAQQQWSQVPEAAWDDEMLRPDAGDQQLFQRALRLIQCEFEERSWQAFWRVVVDGRSPQEVAAELAMSAGAVRVAKCRVLHRLRQELGDVK